MIDYQTLPRIKDSLTYIYVEHARIEKDQQSIAIFDKYGKTPVPIASIMLLILGPGTSITQSAIHILALNGVQVIWGGEEGGRYYAHGYGETYSSKNLLWQAYLATHDDLRIQVVRNMYKKRFPNVDCSTKTLRQLRGMEGRRMKRIYSENSARTGVEWKGRKYNRKDWDEGDVINRAISAANRTLYGICHSAIVSLGMSPALGFIHIGHILAFVYDIADLYKAEISIPAAFDVVAESVENIERRVRIRLRDYFKQHRLLKRIVDDIFEVITIPNVPGALPRYLKAMNNLQKKMRRILHIST